ncbi:hypothetical protein [Halovenus salina]|uniref:hypothetical protein n=1 Tax=Halovenus salina TaxID=1510225 RepID=UPI002260BE13|nr:hypothetical protein [Halovenus salina]
MPSPTISGGLSADRTEEFRQAAQAHLPVDLFTTEPHPMQPDVFGDVMIAELDTDRVGLNQYLAFVREYADHLGTDNLRVVNTGIDVRTTMPSRVPRPFTNVDVLVAILIEIQFSQNFAGRDIDRVLDRLENEFGWVTDTMKADSTTGFLQHHGGPNDLVVEQMIELVKELRRIGIEMEQVSLTCSLVER